ncbi:MAG: bifunctional nuclease domain-containing protein [Solirubrobacteraceae bacterium]|jgi:bifunctional DNase/RNase/DNA-binding transcriptional MerR regulator
MPEVDRTWKVGELARATGLTIRALHHYDEIGLLVPGRTQAGHRVYSPADVERLYRVLALRGVGMALEEIAAALDDDGVSLMDTVRRHVAAVERDIEQRRRLLERLRAMLDALERSSAPTVDELIGAVEAMTVVEATIEDVVTREPWEAAWELTAPYVVLLREAGGERILPIWIGEPEAAALVLQRRGATLPRPLGHDLTVALLDAVEARVERVVIERLRDNTFFATVTVAPTGDPHEVDARPSDALNLAVRFGAPIQVASEVIDTAGTTVWPDARETVLGVGNAPPWTPVSERHPWSRPPTYAVGQHSPTMLRLAAAEAQELGHDSVGSAHLLLGILADKEGAAAGLLARHGVALSPAREAVARTLADAHDAPTSAKTIFLTPRATFAMSRASVEARRRCAPDIAPMHLLLALLDSSEAAEILGLSADDLATVRADVLAELEA